MSRAKRFLPFILTFIVVIADQLTKLWVVNTIPEGTVAHSFFNDWLWIVHVRNDAVAFSMGSGIPVFFKYIFFIGLPIALMVAVCCGIIMKRFDDEFTYLQRWCLAGILGGGIGNIIDRIFRSLRVVDWISTDLNGFLGMDRFPTWNIADGAVVCFVILLAISIIAQGSVKDGKEG